MAFCSVCPGGPGQSLSAGDLANLRKSLGKRQLCCWAWLWATHLGLAPSHPFPQFPNSPSQLTRTKTPWRFPQLWNGVQVTDECLTLSPSQGQVSEADEVPSMRQDEIFGCYAYGPQLHLRATVSFPGLRLSPGSVTLASSPLPSCRQPAAPSPLHPSTPLHFANAFSLLPAGGMGDIIGGFLFQV